MCEIANHSVLPSRPNNFLNQIVFGIAEVSDCSTTSSHVQFSDFWVGQSKSAFNDGQLIDQTCFKVIQISKISQHSRVSFKVNCGLRWVFIWEGVIVSISGLILIDAIPIYNLKSSKFCSKTDETPTISSRSRNRVNSSSNIIETSPIHSISDSSETGEG
jgi:hypothetical protein